MEVFCTVHPNEHAVGKCSSCGKPHCLDCLDMETGKVLCPSCQPKAGGAPAAVAAPAPVETPKPTPVEAPKPTPSSPFDFKGKGLDDDPLGLMNAPTPVKAPAPKPAPAPAPLPKVEIPMPSFPAPSSPKPLFPKEDVPAPVSKGKGLDLFGEDVPKPAQVPDLPPGSAPPLSYPLGSISGIAVPPPKKGLKSFYLVKAWAKYLLKRAYEVFDPLARLLRLPTYAALILVGLLLVGAVLGVGMLFRPSPVKLVKLIAPLQMVKVGSSQISDLDVTSFLDLQGQLQALGFTPLTQFSVTQLPSTNFFDVWIKEDVGTYGEILKFPNQITPRVAFVTVLSNGVWMATDSWQGGKTKLAYLDSECVPNIPAQQLYVKHVQKVDRMKKDGLQAGLMGENRYLAALSDHLRWFMKAKDLPSYKLEFTAWH